ncbi:MAG: LysM peptidoglycan-binding domain-containing protein [Ectobacillus sp.]
MKKSLESEIVQQETIANFKPRSEVHKKRKRKAGRFRIRYFFIRMLTLLFILVPVFVLFATQRYVEQQEREKMNLRFETNEFEEIFFETNPGTERISSSDFQAGSFIFHKVKEGETLTSIADLYFSGKDGETILYTYNRLRNTAIAPGQVLKIPTWLITPKKR